MQGRISNIVPIVLITVFSVIGVEGAYQALDFFVLEPAIVSQKDAAQKPKKEANLKDTQGRKTDYRIILKRNLFGTSLKNDKPEAIAPAPQPIANASELGIVLMGTISGSGNNNRAIILNKQTRDQELFSTGEVVEGALIKDIQRGKLFLSINGKDEVLNMTEAATMRPAYQAPPASTANRSTMRIAPGAGINTVPTPRRRVIRRPRPTQQ